MPLSLRSAGGTGGWSAKGCELLSRNRTHVACQCSHTASFAVLMDVSRREVGAAPRGTPPPPRQVYGGIDPMGHLGLAPNLSPQRCLSFQAPKNRSILGQGPESVSIYITKPP